MDDQKLYFRQLQNKGADVVVKSATVKNHLNTEKEPKTTESEIEPLPPIRSCATISVNLSSRQFITPKRESLEQAEREWCAKQHEIIANRIGICDKDLNADERDFNWLLQKGNAFLEKKNFLAAVSAFTCGLKVSNDSPELFLGRARAHFGLKNYKYCVSFQKNYGKYLQK